MLEFRINEVGSQKDPITGNFTRYGLNLTFERLGSIDYDLNDFRLRGFFNHHYVLTTLNTNGAYFIKDIQQFQVSGGFMTDGYDDWMNDVRPPRIDTNKFSSEVIAYLPNIELNNSVLEARDGRFNLRGEWIGTERLGRYDDVEESYSFVGENTTITNPMNWVLEKRNNSKTRNISNISSTGNLVTVITTTSHGYSTGDSVRITGLNANVRQFGNPGERYEGTFKITVISANSFTYSTKHIVTASTHTTGIVEFWEVFVYEQDIDNIQGNGSGLITITTNRDNHLQIGDIIQIEDTVNYNAIVEITSKISNTQFECLITGNTSTISENIGILKYSSRPPSGAIGVNYVSGYEPKFINDHTTFTYLIYSDKDTFIDNQVANDNGSSTQLQLMNFADNNPPIFKRIVFRFPISSVPLSDLLFAEINTVYASGSDSNAVMSLYQMIDDNWSDSDTWDIINPKIDETNIVGFYNFINVGSGENNTYTKFSIDNSKIIEWIIGTKPPVVGFVKTDQVNSINNIYWSSETDEFKPYIVVSSGVVDDDIKPEVNIDNANTSLMIDNIQGDGSGKIIINTLTEHNLSSGDIVDILSHGYNSFGLEVLGGVDSPTLNQFKVQIVGNTNSTLAAGGIIYRHSLILVEAIASDDKEISDDPSNILVRKTNNFDLVSVNNIVKTNNTILNFDFLLKDIVDGYFDMAVFDVAGNKSNTIKPPILMYYTDTLTQHPTKIVRHGDLVDVYGFNLNDPFQLVISHNILNGGLYNTGLSQSITMSSIFSNENKFTFTVPSGLQNEYNVLSVDHINNTITVEGNHLQVNDIVVFNSVGNKMNLPLFVGDIYFVIDVAISGTESIIKISNQYDGNEIDLLETIDINMVMYNYITPIYLINNGYDSSEYNNYLGIRIDDFAPKIDTDPILGTGTTINVVISDICSIDQSSVSFINGEQTGSPIIDVDENGRVLIYEILITGEGTFRVDVSDDLGNSSFAIQEIPSFSLPFIEIIGYNIIDKDNFILNVRVIDNDIPAIVSDNSTPGIFVESSANNINYGNIINIVSSTNELTFDILVNDIGDGVMTIYAMNNSFDSSNIKPPVLLSVSPDCFKSNNEIVITGVNLNTPNTELSFLNPLVNITNRTMTSLKLFVSIGAPDGNFNFTASVTNEYALISNTITSILDNTPPIISLIGDSIIDIVQNNTYSELGAVAIDNIFGDVSDSINIEGFIDTSVLGTYYLLYTAFDLCGNESFVIRQINVVTGCPIFIAITPNSGFVGDLVTINATIGEFNPIPINNIVTFNNVIATVVSGNRTELNVIVPYGASSGNIQVETGSTNTGYENCSLSNIDFFTVKFNDEEFPVDDNKDSSITRSGRISLFSRGVERKAIYNRDLGYSQFTEITDENSMIQNLYSIILTRRGERFFNPTFGTNIEYETFAIIDDLLSFEQRVLDDIVKSVELYENRITILVDESFVTYNDEINDVMIVLKVLVPSGNVRVLGISLKSIRNSEPSL